MDPASPADMTDDANPGRPVQVGVVAERLGLSVRTLHHWDEMGLVVPSVRSAGGFRLYTDDDISRLHTVRRMKPLGFTLDEMKALLGALDALQEPRPDAAAVQQAHDFIAECHQRAQESCETLRTRLAWAEEFRDLLAGLAAGYQRPSS